MKTFFSAMALIFTLVIFSGGTLAVAATDFSGTWLMNVSKSKNIGMMSNVQLTVKIKQTANEVFVSQVAILNGQEQTRELRYDLSGKPVANLGPMGDPNETVTKWAGSALETIWTQEGAVAGTKVVRTETRSLSSDGKSMSDEYVRGSNPPMVLVFDKQ
jgi:hypothetical protein